METTTFWTVSTRNGAPPIIPGDTSDCPLCNGTGTVTYAQRYRRKRGAKWDDEPEVIAEEFVPPDVPPMVARVRYPYPQWSITSDYCPCRQPVLAQERMVRVLGQPGMPEETFRFDDFDGLPHMAEALAYARLFATEDLLVDADGVERTGLLLAGPTGTGKTSLGKVVFLSRLKAGQIGSWVKFTELVERVKATYSDHYDGPSKIAIRDMLMYARFLMLDELGSLTQQGLYFEDLIQFLYQIIDHRLAKRLPTLITTNLREDELLKQFGAPVASRLAGLCHGVLVRAGDFRRKGA